MYRPYPCDFIFNKKLSSVVACIGCGRYMYRLVSTMYIIHICGTSVNWVSHILYWFSKGQYISTDACVRQYLKSFPHLSSPQHWPLFSWTIPWSRLSFPPPPPSLPINHSKDQRQQNPFYPWQENHIFLQALGREGITHVAGRLWSRC